MNEMEQYNILIVDEDEATRCTLADLLRGRDEYRVLVAGEGREAVKMFVEEARIDIVLTDIHMPGFNCLELMSDMQRLRHRPEILIMTSNGSAEVVEQARRIGARSIILKPFEHLDLIEAEVEKAVQALFEARAATSCRMMAPPSGKRSAAAPPAPPPPVTASPPAAATGYAAASPSPAAARTDTTVPAAGAHPPQPPAASPPEEPSIARDVVAGEETIFLGNETPEAVLEPPGAQSAPVSAAPIEMADPPPVAPVEAPDAGLTMKIDRPDLPLAPPPPQEKTAPPRAPSNRTAVADGDGSGGPAGAATPVSTGDAGGGARRPPATDRMRGRVGLPDLGALKTKLFGKGAGLTGGHLARGGFADPVVSPVEPAPETGRVTPPLEVAPGADPVAPAIAPVDEPEATPTSGENAIVADPAGSKTGPQSDDSASAAAAPASGAAEPGPVDAGWQESGGAQEPSHGESAPDEPPGAAAEDATGAGPAAVPAELETILAAGADVDLDKMTLQIPIICLQTWEEQAALDALRPLAGAMKRAIHTWSATRGMVKEDGTVMGEMYCDPIQALEFIRRQKTNGLYLLADFRSCLDDRKVVRMLREMFEAGETARGLLVLTAPVIPIPPELQPACQVFDWPRGGAVDFDQILEEVRTELGTAGGETIDLDPEARRLLLERVQGMPVGRARFEFLCALRGRE